MNLKELKYKSEKEALNFRRKFDLGQSTAINIESLLLKLNLLTLITKMSNDFSGMGAKFGDSRFILINSNHPKGRQNFTICHELFHLFVQPDFTFEMNNSETVNTEIERNADLFASNLLMPLEGIKELIRPETFLKKDLSLDDVIMLEQYFQVSRSAMVFRLDSLKLINPINKNEFLNDVQTSALMRGFSIDLYEPTKERFISSDYSEKSKRLFEKNKIGLSDYSQIMSEIGVDIFKIMSEPEKE